MSSHPESQPPADLYIPAIYTASAIALDGLLKLAGNYEVEVWDKLPSDRAGILAPKHSGVMDIPLLGAATRHVYDRNIRFIAKDTLAQGYRHSDKVRTYFDVMGGIIINQSKRINEQPAGPQIERDINNNQLLTAFNEGGVRPGKEVATKIRHGKEVAATSKIGTLAVPTLTPVQAVGMAGTEGNWRDWISPKTIVYGKVAHPDASMYKPLEDKRASIKYLRSFSEEVDAMMQEVNNRAHQMRSRKVVPIHGLRR